MKLPEIELSGFNHTPRNDPYTICFVYPKDKPPVIIKGMYTRVYEHLHQYYLVALYRMSFWYAGETRGYWGFTEPRKYVGARGRRKKISLFDKSGQLVREFTLRRMPKKWIPEFEIEYWLKPSYPG